MFEYLIIIFIMGKNKNNKKKNIINLDDEDNVNKDIESDFEQVYPKKKNVFELLNDTEIDNNEIDTEIHNNEIDTEIHNNEIDNNEIDTEIHNNEIEQTNTDKYFKLGLNEDDYNYYEEAIKFYLVSIKNDSIKYKGLSAHNLGVIYDEKFDDIINAEKYYKIGSEYKCNDSNCNLGLIYYNKNDYVNASKYLKIYIDNGGIDMFFQYAYCCKELNNYVEGMKYLSYHLMLKKADKDEIFLFKKLFINKS